MRAIDYSLPVVPPGYTVRPGFADSNGQPEGWIIEHPEWDLGAWTGTTCSVADAVRQIEAHRRYQLRRKNDEYTQARMALVVAAEVLGPMGR